MIREKDRVVAITSPEHLRVDVQCGNVSFETSKEALIAFAKSVLASPCMTVSVAEGAKS